MAKIIGNYRFFENEINFRKYFEESDDDESIKTNINIGKELFNYFFKLVLTQAEKIKLKSLKIYSQFKSVNSNKSKTNPISNSINDENEKKNISIININNEKSNFNYIDKYTVTYTGDNNENYLKLKERNVKQEEKLSTKLDRNFNFSPAKNNSHNSEELSKQDERCLLSNSPNRSNSTSPSTSFIVSSNKNYFSKDAKFQDEWTLTSCNEINLNFIQK